MINEWGEMKDEERCIVCGKRKPIYNDYCSFRCGREAVFRRLAVQKLPAYKLYFMLYEMEERRIREIELF